VLPGVFSSGGILLRTHFRSSGGMPVFAPGKRSAGWKVGHPIASSILERHIGVSPRVSSRKVGIVDV
jgi:hypothetical protein